MNNPSLGERTMEALFLSKFEAVEFFPTLYFYSPHPLAFLALSKSPNFLVRKTSLPYFTPSHSDTLFRSVIYLRKL